MAGRVWMWPGGAAGIGTDSCSAFGDVKGIFLKLQDYHCKFICSPFRLEYGLPDALGDGARATLLNGADCLVVAKAWGVAHVTA